MLVAIGSGAFRSPHRSAAATDRLHSAAKFTGDEHARELDPRCTLRPVFTIFKPLNSPTHHDAFAFDQGCEGVVVGEEAGHRCLLRLGAVRRAIPCAPRAASVSRLPTERNTIWEILELAPPFDWQ